MLNNLTLRVARGANINLFYKLFTSLYQMTPFDAVKVGAVYPKTPSSDILFKKQNNSRSPQATADMKIIYAVKDPLVLVNRKIIPINK